MSLQEDLIKADIDHYSKRVRKCRENIKHQEKTIKKYLRIIKGKRLMLK